MTASLMVVSQEEAKEIVTCCDITRLFNRYAGTCNCFVVDCLSELGCTGGLRVKYGGHIDDVLCAGNDELSIDSDVGEIIIPIIYSCEWW